MSAWQMRSRCAVAACHLAARCCCHRCEGCPHCRVALPVYACASKHTRKTAWYRCRLHERAARGGEGRGHTRTPHAPQGGATGPLAPPRGHHLLRGACLEATPAWALGAVTWRLLLHHWHESCCHRDRHYPPRLLLLRRRRRRVLLPGRREASPSAHPQQAVAPQTACDHGHRARQPGHPVAAARARARVRTWRSPLTAAALAAARTARCLRCLGPPSPATQRRRSPSPAARATLL